MLWGVKWYYWAILIITAALAVLMWRKALSVSKARRAGLKAEGEIWKREYELRQRFRVLTDELLKSSENAELLHGVAMNIQIKLEKAPVMNEAFDSLPDEKKYVYTLEYFDEDVKKSLSAFYKNNGSPLIEQLSPALKAIGLSTLSPSAERLLPMFEQDNEVSVDYNIIDETDAEFAGLFDSEAFYEAAADYILKNKDIFID